VDGFRTSSGRQATAPTPAVSQVFRAVSVA